MTKGGILIAGVGNIFRGDDAFGVEVARQLASKRLPEGVRAVDFGIRSYDLALALMDNIDAAILIDATRQGHPPGTVYLMELDEPRRMESVIMNGHSLDPASVIALVRRFGGEPVPLYLVGCEPAVLEVEDGRMELSEPVRQAVPHAIELIHSLIRNLLHDSDEKRPVNAGEA